MFADKFVKSSSPEEIFQLLRHISVVNPRLFRAVANPLEKLFAEHAPSAEELISMCTSPRHYARLLFCVCPERRPEICPDDLPRVLNICTTGVHPYEGCAAVVAALLERKLQKFEAKA